MKHNSISPRDSNGKLTGEYMAWSDMKRRCYNKNRIHYKDYGARGITVCDRWRNSFQDFYRDMGPRLTSKHQIERKDNDGNYEPGNCRWATVKEQANNRRSNTWFEYCGETKTMSQWCELIEMPKSTFVNRMNRGWSIERILEEPIRAYKQL